MPFYTRSRIGFLCHEFKRYFIFNSKFYRSASTFTVNKEKTNIIKLTLAGVGLGTVFGSGFSFYFNKNDNDDSKTSVVDPQMSHQSNIIHSSPNVPISRRFIFPEDSSGLKLVLFQYPTCPFCCKVRAFLNYYGVSYDVVEVNPVLRQQIKWSQYKKVPILLASLDSEEYLQLNDSSMIISGLASYLKSTNFEFKKLPEYYPTFVDKDDSKKFEIMNKYFIMNSTSEVKDLEDEKNERKWRQWADSVLVHTLSPNVYRTKDEAFQAFNWFSEVGEWDKLFSTWERLLIIYVGAYAMYFIGKRLKKKHNLKNAVRESLYDECKIWLQEINKKGTKFHGGSKPNLADLAVYGVLSSIEGCIAFQDLLENTKIGKWYYDMKDMVENHRGTITRI